MTSEPEWPIWRLTRFFFLSQSLHLTSFNTIMGQGASDSKQASPIFIAIIDAGALGIDLNWSWDESLHRSHLPFLQHSSIISISFRIFGNSLDAAGKDYCYRHHQVQHIDHCMWWKCFRIFHSHISYTNMRSPEVGPTCFWYSQNAAGPKVNPNNPRPFFLNENSDRWINVISYSF